MAKTALDLTPEQLHAYHPARRAAGAVENPSTDDRWKRAREVARQAASLLRDRFGATRVVVFGSLTRRTWFTARSDIDLAVWGIPPEHFYRAAGAVCSLSSEFDVDLVDPDACPPAIYRNIEREGIDL